MSPPPGAALARDAGDGAVGLPGLRLVAGANGKTVSKERWIGQRRGEVGRLGDGLLRRRRAPARRHAARAGSASSRVRTSCPRARPPTTRCSSPAAYLVDPASPWVIQSLFLAAIGEARLKRARRRSRPSPSATASRSGFEERFLVHRAIFPHELLADLGFVTVRSAGTRAAGAAGARRAGAGVEAERGGCWVVQAPVLAGARARAAAAVTGVSVAAAAARVEHRSARRRQELPAVARRAQLQPQNAPLVE